MYNYRSSFQVNLPTSIMDYTVSVKKVSVDSNTVTIVPSSGQIDGSSTLIVSAFGSCAYLVCDGQNCGSCELHRNRKTRRRQRQSYIVDKRKLKRRGSQPAPTAAAIAAALANRCLYPSQLPATLDGVI